MTVTWDPQRSHLVTAGGEIILPYNPTSREFSCEYPVAEDILMRDLRRALTSSISGEPCGRRDVSLAVQQWIEPGQYSLNEEQLADIYLQLEYQNSDVCIFYLTEKGPLIASFEVPYPIFHDSPTAHEVISPYLSKEGVVVDSMTYYPRSHECFGWCIEVHIPDHWTVARVFGMTENVRMMLRFREWSPAGLNGVRAMILAGKPEAILGQPESAWLEVKRTGYNLSHSVKDKYELARDLASFANSESGGVIVIGLETEKDASHRDIISCVTPCGRGSLQPQTYANVARDRITPPIEGLDIQVIALSDGDLLCLSVPPQSEELKPFLVSGALIGEKVSGSFFSIPHRRGSDKWDTSPEAAHSLLVAARAILRASQG